MSDLTSSTEEAASELNSPGKYGLLEVVLSILTSGQVSLVPVGVNLFC